MTDNVGLYLWSVTERDDDHRTVHAEERRQRQMGIRDSVLKIEVDCFIL